MSDTLWEVFFDLVSCGLHFLEVGIPYFVFGNLAPPTVIKVIIESTIFIAVMSNHYNVLKT